MKITAQYFPDLDSFLAQCNNNSPDYVLFVASKTTIDLKQFSALPFRIYGAIFPQIIFNNKMYEDGFIAIEINPTMQLHFIEDIQTAQLETIEFNKIKSVVAILEGLSPHNEDFLLELFENIDIDINIIGGGAGLICDPSVASIFDNEKFYHNCAILITLLKNIDLGVKHGWDYLEGPFVVTSSDKRVLKKIDYKSAFSVYRDVIKKDCGIELTQENFLEVSKNYPFGLVKYEGEQVVRDPISFEDGELHLVGTINNNTVINILKGKNKSLLNATKIAAKDALKNRCEFIIMFDCTTRKNFLQEKFDEELDIIFKKTKNATLVGAITLGEIANDGNRYIHFLNKTCVIGGICS